MIQAKNLIKKFKDRVILNDISFSVSKGEIFGYLGPNGAGKTTTIRILTGLLMPTSGDVFLMNYNVKDKLKDIKRTIGVLSENPGLYEQFTIYENLDYYGQIYGLNQERKEKRINNLLELLDIIERKKELVCNLSQGMKQKVAIARSLTHEPSIFIYDEPFNGLDPAAQKVVREIILNLANMGRTIFVSSHNLNEIQQICTRIAILNKGIIQEIGKTDDIINKYSEPFVEIILKEYDLKYKKFIESLDFVTKVINENKKLKVYLKNISNTNLLISNLTQNGIEFEEIKQGKRNLEDIYLSVSGEKQCGIDLKKYL